MFAARPKIVSSAMRASSEKFVRDDAKPDVQISLAGDIGERGSN